MSDELNDGNRPLTHGEAVRLKHHLYPNEQTTVCPDCDGEGGKGDIGCLRCYGKGEVPRVRATIPISGTHN